MTEFQEFEIKIDKNGSSDFEATLGQTLISVENMPISTVYYNGKKRKLH